MLKKLINRNKVFEKYSMYKKNIYLVLALTLIFVLVACNPNAGTGSVQDENDMILEYQENAIIALSAYAVGKEEKNYNASAWSLINQFLEDGIVMIKNAREKQQLDTLLKEFKEAIDSVTTLEVFNSIGFYLLQAAHSEGILTHEDIESIAYYYHGEQLNLSLGNQEAAYVPISQDLEVFLDKETQDKIKEDYKKFCMSMMDVRGATIVLKNLGTYNSHVAIGVTVEGVGWTAEYIPPFSVDGIVFVNKHYVPIIIWELD